MNSKSTFTAAVFFAVGLLSNSVFAAYLDLTDNSTALTSITGGFKGSIDGVGFTLTAASPGVNRNESYDGSATNPGCQANGGPLKCQKDGAGIGNDEISGLSTSSGQIMTLEFATSVYISSLDFLDLYLNRDSQKGGEQARVSIDGASPYLVNANGSSGDGGYASLDLLALGGPVLGKKIEFTAFQGTGIQDDHDNDYAFAGASINAVPVPAAIWLFGSALVGLAGFSKRRKVA